MVHRTGCPLRVLYDLDGSADVPEHELDHLAGYRGSSPVRVGNDASAQLQLDIYSAVLDSVYLYNKHGAPIAAATWEDVCRIVEWLRENWDRGDAGIWETRSGQHEHTHSRVMCWVAIERMIRVARQHGLPADLVGCMQSRDAIHRQIMERGWSEERRAFVQHLDGDALDARRCC